jgi:putative oxidoreductase
MINPLTDWYPSFRAGASLLQSPMLLFVRLYFGWQFIVKGHYKLEHLGDVTAMLSQLGFPGPQGAAIFIAWLEFIGGMLLVVGLVSRITAFALMIEMIVAYSTADRAALFSFVGNPAQFEAAAPFSFLFATSLIFIFGPGLFALDSLISRIAGLGESSRL